MKKIIFVVFAMLAIVGGVLAADSDKKYVDRGVINVSTGTATVNSATADYSKWQPVITIAPDGATALSHVKVVIDLNQASTGFGAVYTSGTITASISRKVDGTNWTTSNNLATATVSGTNAGSSAGSLSLELDLGWVTPTEGCQIRIKISSVSNTNVTLPFVVIYQGTPRATITAAS